MREKKKVFYLFYLFFFADKGSSNQYHRVSSSLTFTFI